jgi:aminoglycoside phosphotransferase family enzyme/predicted kinase
MSAGIIELTLADQTRMVDGLLRRLQAQHPASPVERFETHISFVLVAGGEAYKLKKAVNPGFLDFTTLARRHHFCAEELRLNRRLAPALYLGVVPVTGSIDAPEFGGEGAVIDVALRMRAFDQAGLWDRLAARGALTPAHVDALAEQIERFHRDTAVAGVDQDFGRPPQVRKPMLATLRALCASSAEPALDALRAWEAQEFARLDPVFEQRRVDGRVRECHGDLHLGNVAEVEGRTTVFDCIEFDPALRWIDVVSEIAFMAMDLQAHALPALAHRFVNAYLERSGDYAGLCAWRWYVAYRALVRARVTALRATAAPGATSSPPLRGYLDLAAACAAPPRPALIVTHGFSGSGKTTATESLVEALGAVRVRADVERKRLAGLDPLARSRSPLGGGLYTAASTAATYDRMMAAAAPALAGGMPVVLDATFLERAQRDQARRLARRLRLPFVILDFDLDRDTLRERVRRRAVRGGDASEADLAVLEAQFERAQPLGDDERADTIVCAGTSPADRWAGLTQRLGADPLTLVKQ